MTMTMQEAAQAMLDQCGFFVVHAQSPQEIGAVKEAEIKPEYTNGAVPENARLKAKFKIIATATSDDIARQNALIGLESSAGRYCYRAVAE